MSFQDAPFAVAMSTISAETGVTIVWGTDCDETLISGVYSESKIGDLLLAVAKRNGMQLSDLGGVYYIGTGSRSDLVSTVVRSPTSDAESLKIALRGCLTEYGSVEVVGSNLIVNDYLYNVKKVVDLVGIIRENNLRGYVAQLYFVRMKNSDLLDLQAKFSVENVDLFGSSLNLDTLFKAVLQISAETDRMTVENSPVLYLAEGREASLTIGNEITKSQNSISSEGYSTIAGYKSFSDGITISLLPSRLSTDIISLDVTMTVSQFSDSLVSYSDIPETTKSEIVSPGVLLTPGSVYFLGSLHQRKSEKTGRFFGVSSSDSEEIVTVWVKIREISFAETEKNSNFSEISLDE